MPANEKRYSSRFNTVFVVFMALSCLLFLIPENALAHRVYIFAWVDGDTVYTDCYFGSKKKVIQGLVEVYDLSGNKLLQGKTDDRGAFSFKIPKKSDLKIVLEATMGHRTEYIISKEELTETEGGLSENSRTHKEKAPALGQSAVDQPALGRIDQEQIRIMIEETIDKKLKPISKSITLLNKEKEPGAKEIFSGLGYIIGIMGIVLYIRSRRFK